MGPNLAPAPDRGHLDHVHLRLLILGDGLHDWIRCILIMTRLDHGLCTHLKLVVELLYLVLAFAYHHIRHHICNTWGVLADDCRQAGHRLSAILFAWTVPEEAGPPAHGPGSEAPVPLVSLSALPARAARAVHIHELIYRAAAKCRNSVPGARLLPGRFQRFSLLMTWLNRETPEGTGLTLRLDALFLDGRKPEVVKTPSKTKLEELEGPKV